MGSRHGFQFQQGGEQAPVLLLESADVLDGDAGRGIAAEKELEQELVARGIFAIRNGEPLLKAEVPGWSQRVFLPLGPGLGG